MFNNICYQKNANENHNVMALNTYCCCSVTKSCLTLFQTQWTVTHQAPLSMGLLEWVAISFSKRPSQPRDRTRVSCTGFPHSSISKESAWNAGNLGSIPGWGRSPGKGNGNPSQYSCLENRMDRGAWQATVCGVERVGLDWATKHPRTLLHWRWILHHWATKEATHLLQLLKLQNKKLDSTKFWQRFGATGIFTTHAQLYWKTVWSFIIKLNICS